MNCTINDLIISFDVDNRLRSTIGHITGFDLNKAYALAGFLRDAKFKSFLSNRLTENDVLKDKVVDLSNIKEEDYVNLKQNKLGALLNLYYIEKYHSVANSKTVKNLGILNGFSSATAKKIAKEHTAKLLREEYRKEINKPVRRTGAEIIESVNQQLLDTFYENYVELFVEDVLGRNVFSKAAKDYAQHYRDILEKGKELANLNKRDNSEYKTLAEEIKKFKKGSKESEDIKKKAKEIQKRILARNKQMNVLRTDRYVVAQNLVNLYSNNYEEHARERIRNFANLVAQSRGDANGWYYQVFHTKGMTDIYKLLHNVGDIEEFLEYQDTNNDEIISKYNDQGIDETSKTWEDHFYKSFEEGVSSALRMELSNIPVITQPYNIYSTEQALDTNNPLGVSTTMNSQLVLTEIFTYGDFSSREAFIESINKRANSVPALYGLGYIVNRMRTNREYLNLMFTNFAKPIFYKSVLTINNLSSETGVSFDYSNPNALPLPEMIFRLTSKLRSTFNDNFDNSDIAKLNEINSKFKSYNNTNLSELVIELHEVISKYFPNIDKASIEKVFTGKQPSEIINNANSIITSINTIIGEMQKIRKKTNDENIDIRKRNDERYEAWKKEYKLAKLDGQKALPEQPVYEQFKPVSFDLTPTANKAIISLSKILIENSETKVRLNSTNAEGNSSSDVGKNCYISRFFEAILSDDSNTSRKGLENLLSYITQGVEGYEDQNQYANNPLFFGVKDENGIELCKGMFTRTSSGIVINDNARDILNYHLFDGAKNTATGDANNYANMSKLDYFITQFMAFNNSIDAISNDTKTKEIGEMPSAVYPMRVASDAPKIFFIRAPRYSNKEVRASLYNHVLDELNMFVNGLNNIFKLDENDNTFKTITDITNLYGRAYFNERTANKLRREDLKNGVTTTDYTPAIVDKNGRLIGNMFKFLRLRNLEKYNAEQEIMNIISLYGGGNVNPLIVPDKNGRLRLNENRLSDTDIIRFDGKRIVLNLNAQQKLALKEIVNKWADAYLVEARNKVSEYLDVLKEYGYKVDMNIVNSYLLNNYNMNIAYDDLFEGDYKFYNGARDFLKRMKESQAGGDGYAAYNILSDPREGIKEFEDDIISIKSSNTISPGVYLVPTWEGGKIVEKPLSLRSGWRGVTIYNTVKPSDNAKDIAEELEKIFIKQKVSNPKERATIIAKGYFSLAKVNDAQSYITLEEFIRRRYADGTLNMYQDLIGQLLDPNITAEQIDLTEVNARIQVQKNFYFDKVFDKDTGEFVARQIKNAEFVLIPKLLPEGSELRKIYDWMKANDIGQLNTAETSKAAKKSIFTIWDEQTGKFNENFEEDFSDEFIEEYSYKYLYKQQEVPEHMRDTKNKAGTQFIKKIIDNVSTAGEQVQTWAEEFLNAYGANIKEDFNNFLYSVGWDYDVVNGKLFNKVYATTDSFGNPLTPEQIEENKYNLKMEYFYERFREEATRLGMDSNFMEYLTLNEFGIPMMPNVMNTSMSKLESIAQALWNSGITRQTLSGWHAAQVTDVGYSKRLNFDAKTGVMEVYLPRWSKLIPKAKNAEEEAEILKMIHDGKLDIQIGYRIPTEGKQSICVLKVVGFTHDALGSTIVVPEDWVVQTGADFDVDSIYGISWEMYEATNEDGKKVLKKIPYTEKTTDNKKLYIGYVKNKINENVNREKIGEEIDETLKSIRDELNNTEAIKKFQELFNKLDEERNELYSLLPGKYRGIIANINKETPKILKEGIYRVDIKQAYPKIIEQLSLAVRTDSLSDETLNNVLQYIDLSLSLIDVMNQQEGLPAFDKELYKSKKADAIAEIIEKANEAYFNKVQEAAKKAGIISFDEFVELPFVERLSRKARNNYILERCINIMMDSSSREEQYMRSNFDDLKEADNKVSDYSGESKRIYNPYDSLDQLDYFEDALGGRALKARSVNWDTFISKMNKVHAVLGEKHAVEVIINLEEKNDNNPIYDFNEINSSYEILQNEVNQSNKIEEVKLSIGLGNTKRTITKERLKELLPIIQKIIETGDTIEWKPFNVIKHKYRRLGEFGTYTTLDVIKDIMYDLTADDSVFNFKKGQIPINDAVLELLNATSIEEFEALADEETLSNIIDYFDGNYQYEGDYNILTNEIINKFIDENPDEEVLLKAISQVNFANIISLTYKDKFALVDKEVLENERLKKFPNAYQKILEIYNYQNNIPSNNSSKQVRIVLNQLGWSENNRNITGSLITAYASQTTAHHLDAVKEGSIKNVNDYTFGVYKFLTAIGLDYEHSIAFIRQPIITRLVNNYNITNSVFFKNSDDPLFMTFRDIAKDLNVYHGKKQINDESSIYDVIQGLQENTKFVEAVNNILGVDISEMTLGEILSLKFPLRKNWLLRRIEVARDTKSNAINVSANNAYTLAAMDFSILIMFNGYNNTATTIENYISATTVDKTGAKPEVRETRVQYDTIERLRDKLDITVDGVSLINAIYPRDDNGQINIEESKYPYLASIFKYVIKNSNAVNTQLFITENEDFTNAEDFIRNVLGRKLTAQEYKEYKRYYINFMYNKLAKILSPITLDERGNIFANEEDIDKTSTKYWNDERSRIVGYGITTSDNLSLSDVNNPKPDEIEAFAKLTPAQKVIFIQRNFADDQGIFKYINVTLFNPVDIKFRGISRQYLSYSDQVDNIEDLYHLFNESFANKNPLIKLATIDLIKYAFIAEGFNFKSGYISKIITNSSLYTPQNQGGMDIINGVNSINEWLKLLPSLIQGDDFIFKYIRSHSNLIKPIAFKPYPKIVKSREGYDIPAYQNQTTSILNRRNGDGLIYLNGLTQDKFEKDIIEHKLKLKDNVGRFIKLVLPNRSNEFKSYLYFVTCKNDIDYYLIPLNLLDVYETYDNSYNTNNNQFASYDYYLTKIEDLTIKAQQARKIRRTPSVYDVPSTGEKVGKFRAASQYDVNDATTIIQLTNSSDAHIQGAATKFTERIEKAYFDTIKSGDRTRSIIHQPNRFLADLFTENTAVVQHIELSNGELIDVTITKLPVTGKFTDLYYGRTQLKNADARHAFDSVISDMKNNGIAPRQTNIYQIEINERENSPVKGNNMYASTEEISSSSPLAISKPLDIDRVSTTIVRQISYVQRREDSNSADRFIREMSKLRLNANSAESIKEHREDIYKAAATYYRSAASNILHKLKNYVIDEDNVFSMDNPELYEKLGEHQELFEDVAYTILDALTFGNKIKDIFNLNLAAEDESTKRSIESIIKSIRDVTQNDIVRQALDNIFNIYLSKYSNNPDIINDLINLRETYGDTDYIYSLITAPTEIANSEVQVVLKQVYSMISKAEMFDVAANLKEWDEELAKIEAMTENIDMNKIIDSEQGKIRQAYTEDFIKDRRKVLDDYNEAKQELLDKYAEVISSGVPIYKELKVAFKKYIDAQYAKDEFLFKYTERPIADEYYRRDLEMRKKAMTIGKDTFYEYKLLTLMLSDTSFAVIESPEDAAKRKKNIIKRLSNLKSTVDITGSEKPKENALQVAALNNYLDAHKKLQEEFIDVQEYDGFREEYERHNNFIKEYDLKNPHTSLDAKVTDPLYREAYEWIESNGRVGYNKEAEEKLNSVYKVLLNRANYLSKKIRTRLKNIPDLYDEHGVLDARKLNDAQIKALKNEETTDLATMYETGHGEATLIKIVPKNIPLLVKKSTNAKANNILNSLKYTDAALKYKTIQEINEILIKIIDNYTGELRIEDLFNNDIVTEEERVKLANAYKTLRNITSFADKKYKRRKNEVYEDKTHYEEYYKAKAFYDSLPAKSPLAKQWLDIFLEIDDQGNPVPNRFIYGYRVPKEEYTDKTKTEAIKFLEDNIEYTRTEYYYEAYKEKQAEGEEAFDKWFKANHVYNPYTHAYQPLKVWTTPTPKPGSYLANNITYVPTFDNMERSIKDGKDNKNYKRFSVNYREGSGKYDSGIILNNKEKELRKLIVNTLNKYATTYEGKRFVNEGYLPRERQREINGRWVVDQAAALLGLSWHSGTDSDAFRESTDYENDRDIDIPMLQLLKGKGTRKYISYPPKGNMKESEYAKLIEPIKKENEEIRQANLRIDNAQLNRNWLEVMRDFVKAATIHNARNAVKPYLYLLEEDLANNKAYMLKGMFNRRLVKDYNSTTSDYTSYRTTEQTNTKKLISNLSRRIIYDQHHENSEARTIANFLQNMTSAKYMVFNLYGGIANVTTGKVNVRMEEYANEYFGVGQFAKAELKYGKSILGIISSLYSDKAPDLTTAIIKRFNVVNFDDMLQFGAGSHDLDTKLKRTRDFMYSFQSMGEHYMQNSVLLAMLDSNRLYQQNGKWQIGDFTDFNRGVEDRAMEEVLADYEDLRKYYKLFKDNLKSDLQAKYDVISRRKDINRSFLHTLRDASSEEFSGKYKIIAEAYNKRRKELTAKAKEEFGKHKTLNELFEYKNGFAEVKEEYLKLVNKEAKNTNDTLEFLLSQFKEKVINTNQKIHGYYDKKGAAWIESTWIGSLIMQYHKHLPMGIMKRYRRKGFHSELRGKEEYGVYQTLVNFLGTEFTNFGSRVKTKKEDGTNVALASIQVTMQSLLNTITNMSLNWNNLSDWEQANMKRIKGDMSGVLLACLITMAMYGLFDDDELKDDRFKASLIYLADRLYSDSTMYTPVGLVSEGKTAWSSPIASANGPSDLIKAMTIIPQYLFDPEFDRVYKSGVHAGKDKLQVLIRRNIPGVRPYDRIMNINRNNEYYKIGQSQLGINIAKNFGESLYED